MQYVEESCQTICLYIFVRDNTGLTYCNTLKLIQMENSKNFNEAQIKLTGNLSLFETLKISSKMNLCSYSIIFLKKVQFVSNSIDGAISPHGTEFSNKTNFFFFILLFSYNF